MLVSNPMVSSRMCRVLFLVIRRRSGRREIPVTREGDRKAGRSAYMEQLGSADTNTNTNTNTNTSTFNSFLGKNSVSWR